jgi:hypothetical protein
LIHQQEIADVKNARLCGLQINVLDVEQRVCTAMMKKRATARGFDGHHIGER